MGGANSKNSTDILNEAITNVLMQNSMNCTQAVDTTQIITIKNIDINKCTNVNIGNIDQTANLSPNLKCAQQTQNSADIMSKISDEIKQKAESVIKNIPVASKTDAENIAKITNLVENNIDIVNIVNCAQQTTARQITNIEGIKVTCPDSGGTFSINGIKQNIIANGVVDCNSKNENTVKVTNDMQALIDQSAKAEIDGWDPLGFIGTIVGALILAILFVVVIGKSGGDKEGVQGVQGPFLGQSLFPGTLPILAPPSPTPFGPQPLLPNQPFQPFGYPY